MTKQTHKGLKVFGAVLLGLLLILLLVVAGLWGHEIISVASIRQLTEANPEHNDGATYEMHVSGDYYFDDFLEQGGAATDSQLISFITGKITKGIIPMNIKTTDISCSAFTATTEEGDRVFGRNYDFSKTNTAIVYTNPGHGRHASVSTVDLSFISVDKEQGITGMVDKILCLAAPYVPLDGVNDAGLSCGIFMSYQGGGKGIGTDQQTEKPDLTSTTMLRMILDYAATVDEAVTLVEQYDLHDSANSSFHYMIADAQGNSAILEWVGADAGTDTDGSRRTLNVIRNTDNFQCITNFILADGYYQEGDSQPGLDRYDYLTEQLTESNGTVADEEAAMALLAGVGRRNWQETHPDSNGTTIHSVVYNLTDCTSYWVGNEHYGEAAYSFHCAPEK